MRQINEAGLNLLESFETLQLKAYDDGGGVWTIGWGHTGDDVMEGREIDIQEAKRLLELDLEEAEQGVTHAIKVMISDNQFSALVCMAFNIGVSEFKNSTLAKIINGEHPGIAADEFGKWVHQKGKVLNGLIKRRAAERKLFLS